MKVGLVQMNIEWQSPTANLLSILSSISNAEKAGAELLIFPEMSLTGFSMNPSIGAIETKTSDIMSQLLLASKDFNGLIIIGIAVREPSHFENKCYLIHRGKIVGEYSKAHLFSFANENKHYQPGKQLLSFRYKSKNFSPLICYDLRFGSSFETLSSIVDGAFIVIANWPSQRREHWNALLKARAIDNQTFVIAVNRVGTGDQLNYCGDSKVIDPSGVVIYDASDEEGLHLVDIDFSETQKIRNHFPLLLDKNTENKNMNVTQVVVAEKGNT